MVILYPVQDNKEIYKIKRNIAKNLVKRSYQDSLDMFIANIEDKVHGRQSFLKALCRHQQDTCRLNVIDDDVWRTYYKHLWYQDKTLEGERFTVDPQGLDGISFEEVVNVVEALKNREATAMDRSTAECWKYGGDVYKRQLY